MSKTAMILIGVFLIIGGLLALINPFAASLAVTTLVGLFFLVAGVLQAWVLFRYMAGLMGAGQKIWSGLLALLTIIVGVWLLTNPLAGTVGLTLVVGAVFFISGLVRLVLAYAVFAASRMRQVLVISGIASLIIGLIVFFNVGNAVVSFLGILLGIQLLFDGIGVIAAATALGKGGK